MNLFEVRFTHDRISPTFRSGTILDEAGVDVEGKFRNGWFDCTVLETRSDGTTRVKWAYDASETELVLVDLRPKPSTPMHASLEAGRDLGFLSAVNCDYVGSSPQEESGDSMLRRIAVYLWCGQWCC